MNTLILQVKAGLIERGYCVLSVDLEIIPWLNKRRIQPGGRFKTVLDICKDKVSLSCSFREQNFIQKLVDYIVEEIRTFLTLRIVPFQKPS